MVFDINAVIGQNLMSKSKWWVLVTAYKWDVGFLMDVLGTVCCQHIHQSRIWCWVLSVINAYDHNKKDNTIGCMIWSCALLAIMPACLKLDRHDGEQNPTFVSAATRPFTGKLKPCGTYLNKPALNQGLRAPSSVCFKKNITEVWSFRPTPDKEI